MIHRSVQVYSSVLFILMLSLFLAACSTGNTNIASTPRPTPSPSIANPTLSSTTPSIWKLYASYIAKTSGYTIRYQSAWQVQPEGGLVTFSDSQHLSSFAVSPNADPDFGYKSSLSQLDIAQGWTIGSLQLFNKSATNVKKIKMASTVTIHGVIWAQAGETADISLQRDQTVTEETVILANHNNQQHLTYVLQFTAPTSLFKTFNSSYFDYMVQSFAYSS